MAELFTNNASSTLAAGITAVAASLTLQTGDGAKYPSPTGSDYFRVLLFKKTTGEWEICLCTSRTGDVLTITRAQEGTTAIAFNADDLVELRATAAFFASLTVTSSAIQDNSFKYDVETGAADAYVITPTPAISAYAVGQEFWFIPTNTNTGPGTLSVSGVATPPSIKLINGDDPYPGALTAGRMAHVIHDGTNYVLQNPHEKSYYFPNITAPVTATHTEINRLTATALPYDLKDDNGVSLLLRGGIASAINWVTLENAASGNKPKLYQVGTDDVGIDIEDVEAHNGSINAPVNVSAGGNVSAVGDVGSDTATIATSMTVAGKSVKGIVTGTSTISSVAHNASGNIAVAHGLGNVAVDWGAEVSAGGGVVSFWLFGKVVWGGLDYFQTIHISTAVPTGISYTIPATSNGNIGFTVVNYSGFTRNFTINWWVRPR